MFIRCNFVGEAELFQQWRNITVILIISGGPEGATEEDW